jgi:plastocyanin domain-containing protein
VVFTELGIERELPPNKTVVIEIPAQGASELHFACGMGMYRGTLLVR